MFDFKKNYIFSKCWLIFKIFPVSKFHKLQKHVFLSQPESVESVLNKMRQPLSWTQLTLHLLPLCPYTDVFLLFGSLFIFQGPYSQCFGYMHAKNVNSVGMYTAMRKLVLLTTDLLQHPLLGLLHHSYLGLMRHILLSQSMRLPWRLWLPR